MFKDYIFFACMLLFINHSYAIQPNPAPTNILSVSQQPGPFISFGQTLIAAKDLQLYLGPYNVNIQEGQSFEWLATSIYGISDNLALLISIPFGLHYVSEPNNSSGVGDTNVQLEYGFYNHSSAAYQDLATVGINSS